MRARPAPSSAVRDVEQRRALADYGERLGRAFQIADDLLDVEGEAATVGKATGKDAGKATLVSIMGIEAAKAELAELEADALSALHPFGAARRYPARSGRLRRARRAEGA